jgi:hypothetical protein
MNSGELKILEALGTVVRRESVSETIDSIIRRVEQKMAQDLTSVLAWEPVPLAIYGKRLPNMIDSGWVFVLRAQTTTGAERHPNSHQRMMSYRGSGDFPIWNGERWCSNHLVSDASAPLVRRWLSIPPDVWHQAVVPQENWVVLSFHTVPEDELIEELPDTAEPNVLHQRRYIDMWRNQNRIT